MFAKRNKKQSEQQKKEISVLYGYMSWLQVIDGVVSSLVDS